MTENSGLTRSNASSVSSDILNSTTSATTFDLCIDLQDSSEDPEGSSVPDLPRFVPCTVNKKRDHEEYLASSSDAPLFSSDDLPASSAENYIEPRVKRQHQRPWYEIDEGWCGVSVHSSIKKPRMKKSFQRTYDSGVWLGSDESTENEDIDRQDAVRKALRVMEMGGSIDGDDELWDEDEEGLNLGDDMDENTQTLEEKLQQALVKRALQLTEDPGGFEGPVFPYWQKQPNRLLGFHEVQQQAQKKVALCIEEGAEVVDLSYVFAQNALLLMLDFPTYSKLIQIVQADPDSRTMYMQQIRTPTLRPLRYYTVITPKQGDGTGYYQSLTPALRLYLSNNLLEEIPGEIFHLKNLQVLSLRSNNLTEILPSIGDLMNLKELNLGSNQLNWLPWELIGLLHADLQKCMIYPNPLFRPVPSIWNPVPSRKIEPHEARQHEPRQVASTQIAFLDITGASIRHWPPAPSSLSDHWPDLQADDESLGPPLEERTKTPSLLELALRACKESPKLSQFPFLIPNDYPQHLTKLLQRTWKLKEAGGITCSVCGDDYIIPRTEWIEWWYCIPEQGHLVGRQTSGPRAMNRSPVPLLRRGCSWACWMENGSPLIRGWSSATLPGGLKDERVLPSELSTPPHVRRTIPPKWPMRRGAIPHQN